MSSYFMDGKSKIDTITDLSYSFLQSIECHLKQNKQPSSFPMTNIQGHLKVKTEATKIRRQRKFWQNFRTLSDAIIQ